MTADIPLVGGPGDGQSITVPVDEDGMPPAYAVAFVLRDDSPRVEGTYTLEPVAGGIGPPWLYQYSGEV